MNGIKKVKKDLNFITTQHSKTQNFQKKKKRLKLYNNTNKPQPQKTQNLQREHLKNFITKKNLETYHKFSSNDDRMKELLVEYCVIKA